MVDVVRFVVVDGDDAQAVVPEVNGGSLVEAVALFEALHELRPAGGYGGLVPAQFRFGDLGDYLLGRGATQWPEPGRLWLLGCDCGELGCWPLEARVEASDDLVVWTDFAQPHRPARSYAGFGPFVFDRDQYDAAVTAAVEELFPPV